MVIEVAAPRNFREGQVSDDSKISKAFEQVAPCRVKYSATLRIDAFQKYRYFATHLWSSLQHGRFWSHYAVPS